MYDAGAKGCFDVMATQGYGFFSGPTDQRMRPTMSGFSRSLYLRDMMVRNGDAETPIWISEAAWNPVDSPEVPEMPLKEQFGSVTREQAARYMPLAYDRAQREWPWVGVINYWFFKLPGEDRRNEAFYYFRMVEPDFTPLPVYAAMRDYIAAELPTLYQGTHPESHRAIAYDDGEVVALASAELGAAMQTTEARMRTQGTLVRLRWLGETPLIVQVDDGPAQTLPLTPPDADGWRQTTLADDFIATAYDIALSSDAPFLLDSVRVFDATAEHLIPTLGALAAVALVALGVLAHALWTRFTRERAR